MPGILWAIIILVLSGIPGNKIPDISFPLPIDKLVHFTMYAALSFLFSFWQLLNFPEKTFRRSVLIFIFSSAYGLLMEILQQYVFIKRSADLVDMIFNMIGAVTGIILVRLLLKKNIPG